ncbi:hypothetical protein ACJX0J_041310, partial [Zea mays]
MLFSILNSTLFFLIEEDAVTKSSSSSDDSKKKLWAVAGAPEIILDWNAKKEVRFGDELHYSIATKGKPETSHVELLSTKWYWAHDEENELAVSKMHTSGYSDDHVKRLQLKAAQEQKEVKLLEQDTSQLSNQGKINREKLNYLGELKGKYDFAFKSICV